VIHLGPVDAQPEDVGFDAPTIARLDDFFLHAIDGKHIQCASYVLSRNGKIFAHKSVGKLSGLEDKGDFLPDSMHGTASATKVFTATAVMQLIEQGKLALDQPVSMILPELKNPTHDKIQIFHLLTHTSGLSADPAAMAEPYPREFWGQDLTPSNWIPFVLQGPLQAPVGAEWNYCSRGFMLLGEIIARVSQMPYDQYMVKHILEPLGMTHSYFLVPPDMEDQVCIVTAWDKEQLVLPRRGPVSSSWAAAGGLYSTPCDLWKWGQMILNKGHFQGKRLLGRKIVEAMTRNQLVNVSSHNWGVYVKVKPFGLGVEIDKDAIFSPGTITHEGFGWTSLMIDPSEQLVCMFMMPSKADWWETQPMFVRQIVLSGIR
jgi:CubicO group peptidase (beta-lactamase class C family)